MYNNLDFRTIDVQRKEPSALTSMLVGMWVLDYLRFFPQDKYQLGFDWSPALKCKRDRGSDGFTL